MTITNGYCTAAELKIQIKKQGDSSTTLTAVLEQAVESASRFIDSMTNKVWYEITLDEEKVDIFGQSANGLYIDSFNRCKLSFPTEIQSISALTEDDVSLTEDTDFYVYGKQGFIEKDSRTWSGQRKAIVVSGTIGPATLPDHVRAWCLAIAGVLTGLDVSIATSNIGDIVEVIKQTPASWVLRDLRANARLIA